MSLSIGTTVIVLLIGIGVFTLGLEAYKQNRPLFQALRSGNRSVRSMLWQALVIWSPVLLVIAILLGLANAISWATTELAYRYTTLDEFCEVQGTTPSLYVACTGKGNVLSANEIRRLDPREDIERQLFQRYRDARVRVLVTPMNELRELAKNPSAFRKRFLPSGVLALAPGSEDDPELVRLVTERRRVMQSPIPMPTDIVEVLSYRQSVDTRNRILREMDARIAARRNLLYAAEYGRLSAEQKLQHDHRNRILQILGKVDIKLDPVVQATLLAPANTATNGNSDLIRKGLVRALADSERSVRELISREIGTPYKAAITYEVLGMTPECTLATENTKVRIHAGDFDAKAPAHDDADSTASTMENAGHFPCFSKPDATGNFKLASVGFRKSVLLSIDRLRDDVAFDAFKQIDAIEQQVENRAVDAKAATRVIADVVPADIKLGRQDCGLFQPVNCVINGFAASAEAAYMRSRNELMDRYAEEADAKVDTSAMTLQQKIDHARVSTDAEVERMHAAGYLTAESLFRWNDLLHAFGWIALFAVAARSFLHVFALEVFDRRGGSRISFDVENRVEGSYVSGPEVTVDRSFPFPIINRGSLTNTLADIKFAPWTWSAPITRILHGRYFLFNWSVFSPPGQVENAGQVNGMEASARSGYSIVEWRMQPGEEVIFHYRDFYGASANVELKTDFSLRLSTLLLGKIFFHYARCVDGEGRLLLEARIHNTPKDSVSSIKPTRLVAWSRHAQFSADSHRQPWKTLINPYTIVRESTPGLAKGLVIIAPESESPHFFGAGIRSLKRIFSRIF